MRASWRSPYHRPTVAAGDAEVQVANAMAELATLTGISPASADFIGRSNSMQVVDFDTFAAICGLTPHRAGLGLPERFPRAGPLPFE